MPHFVYTDHTHLANLEYPGFDRRSLRGSRWIALERALYKNAELIFTRSSNISRSLATDYGCPPEHIACVGAGSNTEVPDSAEVGSERDGAEILFVGVDWERKGGPELLEAFERVRAQCPKARLTIVGCEPEVDSANVAVVSRVPLAEIPGYYERASIFCLPTRREPFGVVVIEALQHGLPVVATRVGAIPDLIHEGENGYLVEPGDVAGLADRLCQLIEDDELRRATADRARKEARTIHTWPAVAGRMADCSREVIEAEAPARTRRAPTPLSTSTLTALETK